jgi:thiamine-phosphate pyrophosphorylase
MADFGLYIILSQPVISYTEAAKICVEEEISCLQLREKELSDRELISIGRNISQITSGTKTRLLINDRPDLASIIRADGYHLGQDDIPFQEAEKIYPGASLRGISTHSIFQAKTALKLKPDYIGFGPLHSTPTKKIPDPVVGLQDLEEVLSFAPIPVVAIGGIDETNLETVLQAGARNICLVRYFMQHRNLKERIRKIKTVCQEYWRS